jgi:hypothetical protein
MGMAETAAAKSGPMMLDFILSTVSDVNQRVCLIL